MVASPDRFACQFLEAVDREHQPDQGPSVTPKLVNPDVGLGRGNSGWCACLPIPNAVVPGLPPLPCLAFHLDLLNPRASKYLTKTPLVDKSCVKLDVEFAVAIESHQNANSPLSRAWSACSAVALR